jgi:hypothetical protein
MPLLDHFQSPISESRSWESFHSFWATQIGRTLNRQVLPPGYFAAAQVHVGPIEVDLCGGKTGQSAVRNWGSSVAEDSCSGWIGHWPTG